MKGKKVCKKKLKENRRILHVLSLLQIRTKERLLEKVHETNARVSNYVSQKASTLLMKKLLWKVIWEIKDFF